MSKIPEGFEDLFEDETKTFLHLATLMPDGSPQLTPVWFNHPGDGEHIWFNTAEGRVKDKNVREQPAVACLIVDPENHYRYV